MDTADTLADLMGFRHSLYSCLGKRADALFELTDASLTAGPQPSPVHLSLEPAHRRGWGSLYAALSHGTVGTSALQVLLARYPLCDEPVRVYGVDCSVWARCDAEASPERGYYYRPSRHSAGQPIVAGWSYQWVAQLGFSRDSWTAPVDVRRVHPSENPNAVAVEQIGSLLAGQTGSGGPASLFVFDAGYDPVQLSLGIKGTNAAILVRLRSGRCFYADPAPVVPSPKGGRPRKHGAKFDCADESTWPHPSHEHVCEDGQYGAVRVRAWRGLHPKQQSHRARGTRSCSWRSPSCRNAPGSRGDCGCGGRDRESRTWTCSGARTSVASIWSIRSGSSSRRWAGPLHGCVIPSKPTGGRG